MKEVTIKGWMARDADGDLTVYPEPGKPVRSLGCGYWWSCVNGYSLSRCLFPDITWESDAREVEITIKIRE